MFKLGTPDLIKMKAKTERSNLTAYNPFHVASKRPHTSIKHLEKQTRVSMPVSLLSMCTYAMRVYPGSGRRRRLPSLLLKAEALLSGVAVHKADEAVPLELALQADLGLNDLGLAVDKLGLHIHSLQGEARGRCGGRQGWRVGGWMGLV